MKGESMKYESNTQDFVNRIHRKENLQVDPLLRTVEEALDRHRMTVPGDHVILGLSGGADSVALLICLVLLAEQRGLTLEAVHVNHGIRGAEAQYDEAFVEELCQKLSVPLTCVHVRVPELARERGLSEEEAGRQARYEAFQSAAEVWQEKCPGGQVRIAVAHHRDDQAETVLWNLSRGSGIRGLGGMAPVKGPVIRPLLTLGGQEIRQWLRQQNIPWVEDSTNQEDTYTRNRIRHTLIPWIREELNPQAVKHLAEAADQAREVDDFLEQEAEGWLRRHLPQTEYLPEDPDSSILPEKTAGVEIPAEEFRKIHPALQGRILTRVLRELSGGGRDLTSRHIRGLLDLAAGDRGRSRDLPGGLRGERKGQILWIGVPDLPRETDAADNPESGANEAAPEGWSLSWETFPYQGQEIPEKECTKWFDYDKISGTVHLRTRRQGDEILLAGVGRKALRRYMIDVHIPAEERDRIPVLADDRQVLWLVGYRMNAACQVSSETKTVLAVTCVRREETL